jgi:hypothetical protein
MYEDFTVVGNVSAQGSVYSSDVVNVKAYGATGDGATDDTAAIQNAVNALDSDGQTLYVPNGNYKTTQPIRLTNRQTKLVGQSYHNTIISFTLAGTDEGAWATSTSYTVGDIVQFTDGFSYQVLTAHTSETFSTDLAAGKWEMWSAVSIRASDIDVSGLYIVVPDKGIGISINGAARIQIHKNSLAPATDNTAYGIVMSDESTLGVLSPGSYSHLIGPMNLIGSYTQGVRQFKRSITTTGTTGGINASTIIGNRIVGDYAIEILEGGGTSVVNNVVQSQTGTAGTAVGVGLYCKLGTSVFGNYFERYVADCKGTGDANATFTIANHHTDNSDDIHVVNGSSPAPMFQSSTGTLNGVGALCIYDHITALSLAGDDEAITTNRLGRLVSGNGTNTKTGIYLSTAGATAGQMFYLKTNSWAFELVENSTADFGELGDRIICGQENVTVGGIETHGAFFAFIFDGTLWNLIGNSSYGTGNASWYAHAFTGNDETLPIKGKYINVQGNGSARTGALLAGGRRHGQELVLYGNTWSVTFAAAAAVWGTAGAPTVGNASTNVQTISLVYTPDGWAEVSRVVNDN